MTAVLPEIRCTSVPGRARQLSAGRPEGRCRSHPRTTSLSRQVEGQGTRTANAPRRLALVGGRCGQENEKAEQARQRELEAALRQLEEEKRRALLLNPGFAVIGLRQVRRRGACAGIRGRAGILLMVPCGARVVGLGTLLSGNGGQVAGPRVSCGHAGSRSGAPSVRATPVQAGVSRLRGV